MTPQGNVKFTCLPPTAGSMDAGRFPLPGAGPCFHVLVPTADHRPDGDVGHGPPYGRRHRPRAVVRTVLVLLFRIRPLRGRPLATFLRLLVDGRPWPPGRQQPEGMRSSPRYADAAHRSSTLGQISVTRPNPSSVAHRRITGKTALFTPLCTMGCKRCKGCKT